MMSAIAGITRMESARVALLQTQGEDGCKLVNASLKSERFLTGPIFIDLLREIHQFFLVSKRLISRHSIGEIFRTSSSRSCSS